MGFLYYTRTSTVNHISPLNMKYALFFSFGIILGLWTTIAISKYLHLIENNHKKCLIFRLSM